MLLSPHPPLWPRSSKREASTSTRSGATARCGISPHYSMEIGEFFLSEEEVNGVVIRIPYVHSASQTRQVFRIFGKFVANVSLICENSALPLSQSHRAQISRT